MHNWMYKEHTAWTVEMVPFCSSTTRVFARRSTMTDTLETSGKDEAPLYAEPMTVNPIVKTALEKVMAAVLGKISSLKYFLSCNYAQVTPRPPIPTSQNSSGSATSSHDNFETQVTLCSLKGVM